MPRFRLQFSWFSVLLSLPCIPEKLVDVSLYPRRFGTMTKTYRNNLNLDSLSIASTGVHAPASCDLRCLYVGSETQAGSKWGSGRDLHAAT